MTHTRIDSSSSCTLQALERQVIVVTGLSGAGKASVMRVLEDLGFYCVDNLPIPLLENFLAFSFDQPKILKVALGIDARDHKFLPDLQQALEQIQKNPKAACQLRIIFLNASDTTLLKRFQETRRRHPLGANCSLLEAITEERNLLLPVKDASDVVLDTDSFNTHQLRSWALQTFSGNQKRQMVVDLVSFGFKYGIPLESNLIYDLRFLSNPYFIPQLKPLSGLDAPIKNYLFDQPVVEECYAKLEAFLQYSLQKSYEEGRFFVTVGIGCTGGRHRSVAFVERLAKVNWENIQILVRHRDIER